MNEFARTLRDLAEKSGKSAYQLAELSGIDPAYVRRLMTGEKRHPSAITLIRLYGGLVADPRLHQKDPSLVATAFGALLSAQLSDAAADSLQSGVGHRPPR